VPSWEAFAAGDWERALELNERERDAVAAKVAEDGSLGVESRRVRLVEKPVTPYLAHASNVVSGAGASPPTL
jgi:hypothetical protein